MCRTILDGKLVLSTRSELISVVKCLAAIRREHLAQQAFTKLSTMRIFTIQSNGARNHLTSDEVIDLIKKTLRESPHS